MPVTQSDCSCPLATSIQVPNSGPGRVASGAILHELGLGVGEDAELAAGHPGLGVRLQADGDAVEPGDGAEQRPGVDVVGEQPAGRGEHAGAEVAGGQLAQLAGQDGESERAAAPAGTGRYGRSP